ncbi:hypothetical protein FRC02_006022 [Tulasnella sp. 418]|nr:hypothetical protein FRC02_006022 [Tulasnella sp. 418]
MDSHRHDDFDIPSPSSSSMSSTRAWEEEVEYTPMTESVLPQTRVDVVFYLYCFVLLAVAYFVTSWLNRRYHAYKLRSETLEKRRRYGIPDDDNRPFDIAYTAAAQRRRQEAEEKRRSEEELEPQQESSSNWHTLDRSTASRFPPSNFTGGTPFGKEGLVRRFPGSFQNSPAVLPSSSFSFTPATNFQNRARLHFGQPPAGIYSQGSISETISSSISPTGPPPTRPIQQGIAIIRDDPSAYQDRYLPPALALAKAARNRYRVPPAASNLGRRSRKQLNLETDTSDANGDGETRNVSRRRLNTWGKDHGIDGDDEARWAQPMHSEPPLTLKDMNRTRKRDDVDSADENDRVKPRRKIAKSAPSVPTVGAGKRKNREDDASEAGDQPRPVPKQKKRVRVVTASEQDLLERHDEEMDQEPASDDPLCEGRRIGVEWIKDGVRFKVGEDGKRLRQVLVKVKKTALKMPRDSRHADRNMAVFEIVDKWVTEDEYAQVQKDGLLAEKSQKVGELVTQPDPTRTSPERRGVHMENSSDWVAATGQTPLKSGSMRTTLGYDRAPMANFSPVPSLFGGSEGPGSPTKRQQVDQTRLNHLVSPAKKAPVGGPSKLARGGTGSGSAWSRWERKNLEAQALAKLKAQRTEILKAAEQAKAPAVATSVSMPSLPVTTPATITPSATVGTKSAEAPANLFKLGTTPALTSAAPPKTEAITAAPIIVSTPSFTAPAPPKTDASSAKPTLSAAPSANPFAGLGPKPLFGAAPATTPSTSAAIPSTEAPKPAVAPVPTSTAAAPSPFSFGNLGATKAPATDSQPAPSSTAPPTLGGFGGPGATVSSSNPTRPAATTPSLFSFGSATATKPAEPAKESAPATTTPAPFGFGAQTTAPSASTTEASKPSAAAPAPAFGGFSGTFGGNKPAGSLLFGGAPASTTAATTSDATKPAETAKPEPPKPLFGAGGFGSTAVNGATMSAPKPGLFSFGSTANTTTTPAATDAPSQVPVSTGFGGFGNKSADTSSTAPKPLNIFGAAVKAATNDVKPVEAPKPAVTFGGFGQPKQDGTDKPMFGGFGSGGFGAASGAPAANTAASGTTNGTTTSKPSFSFSAAPSAAPGSAFGPSTSAFGKAASPSPFAFGSSNPSNGAPPTTTSNPTPFSAPATTPIFNVGTPPPTTPTTGRLPAKPLPRRR